MFIARKHIVFVDCFRYSQEDSICANPYKIDFTNTRHDVIEKYKLYITDKIDRNPLLKEELKKR